MAELGGKGNFQSLQTARYLIWRLAVALRESSDPW